MNCENEHKLIVKPKKTVLKGTKKPFRLSWRAIFCQWA